MSFAENFLHSGALFSTSPKTITIGWGKRLWHAHPSCKGPYFYFPDFFLEQKQPWCSHEFWQEISSDELEQELQSFSTAARPDELKWQIFPKASFKRSYDKLETQLLAGTLQKGVPYIFEVAHQNMNQERLRRCLLALLQTLRQKPLYGYGFWEADRGMLGGTPELLFRSRSPNNRHIETMACAGTEKSGKNEALHLYHPKEQYEHALVIQGVKDSIAALGGTLQIHATELLQLPLLTHLMTPLSAKFTANISFESIVKALHPTPALGALPRIPGQFWLEEEKKNLPRYRYGAPVAILEASKNTTCAVAIRNVQWHGNWMGLGAGCGVVLGSQFENEWNELQLKIASIKKTLDL